MLTSLNKNECLDASDEPFCQLRWAFKTTNTGDWSLYGHIILSLHGILLWCVTQFVNTKITVEHEIVLNTETIFLLKVDKARWNAAWHFILIVVLFNMSIKTTDKKHPCVTQNLSWDFNHTHKNIATLPGHASLLFSFVFVHMSKSNDFSQH